MTAGQIAAVALAWCATSVVVGFGLAAILHPVRVEGPPADAVCIEDGCTSPATHERTVDVTTALVPAGDEDGFSWVVELVCAEHVR